MSTLSEREKAWLRSGDTGASSKCIFSVLTGHYMPEVERDGCYPRDPSDFERCFRLVNLMGWRDRLHEVATACPWFAPFVREWDAMADLYRLEKPAGKAPRLYALMERLVEETLVLTGWQMTQPDLRDDDNGPVVTLPDISDASLLRGECVGVCPLCHTPRPVQDVLREIVNLAEDLGARYADDTPPLDATTAILSARTLLRRAANNNTKEAT